MADSTQAGTPITQAETEFSAVIVDLDKGKVHDDGTKHLADLVEAVGRTGGKGTVTLTITVEPQDPETFDGTGVLVVTGAITSKLPTPKRAGSIFYASGTRGLTRTDPNRDDPRDRD